MRPGSPGVPISRNHAAPRRAIMATWARVSTFCMSVGAPPTPRSKVRGGLNVGSASPPSTRLTSADFSPARNLGCQKSRRAGDKPDGSLVTSGGRPLGECARKPFVQSAVAMNGEVHAAGADRRRGQLRSVEHDAARARAGACPCRWSAHPPRRSEPGAWGAGGQAARTLPMIAVISPSIRRSIHRDHETRGHVSRRIRRARRIEKALRGLSQVCMNFARQAAVIEGRAATCRKRRRLICHPGDLAAGSAGLPSAGPSRSVCWPEVSALPWRRRRAAAHRQPPAARRPRARMRGSSGSSGSTTPAHHRCPNMGNGPGGSRPGGSGYGGANNSGYMN